jgi:hypothetical protein
MKGVRKKKPKDSTEGGDGVLSDPSPLDEPL